jgi:hypothetical protein
MDTSVVWIFQICLEVGTERTVVWVFTLRNVTGHNVFVLAFQMQLAAASDFRVNEVRSLAPKWTKFFCIKMCKRGGGTAPFILNLVTSWRWKMNFAPQCEGGEGCAEPVWAFWRGEKSVAAVGIIMPVAWSLFPAECDGISCTWEPRLRQVKGNISAAQIQLSLPPAAVCHYADLHTKSRTIELRFFRYLMRMLLHLRGTPFKIELSISLSVCPYA